MIIPFAPQKYDYKVIPITSAAGSASRRIEVNEMSEAKESNKFVKISRPCPQAGGLRSK
jgi:hypothetical protein